MKNSNKTARFVVCIDNKGYEASLQIGKLYQAIPDDEASEQGLVRVVDEEGEDYGYPAEWFFPVEIPRALQKALHVATR